MAHSQRSLIQWIAIALAVIPAIAHADLPVCSFFAASRARINDGARVDGDFGVNDLGGRLDVKNGVHLADGTVVIADRVRIGRDSSVATVLANELKLASSAEVRETTGAASLPLDDPFCPEPASYAHGQADIAVADGQRLGPLAPGAYRSLRVGKGSTLTLRPGTYHMKSLQLANDAVLRVGPGFASTIEVTGIVKLGRGAVVDTEFGGPPITLFAGGSRVRVGRGATLRALVSAPHARLTVGRGARLVGASCSAMASVDKEATAACIDSICRDGIVSGAETCDPPDDDACTGLCDNDCSCPPQPQPWSFTDVTAAAGITHTHAHDPSQFTGLDYEAAFLMGGVAAGDYDGDGWVDLYAVGGELGQNALLKNAGDGTFVDMADTAGVTLAGTNGSGPTFADYDADGRLDLLIGGANGTPIVAFHNRGDGTFEDVTESVGITSSRQNVSSAFADYDGDGDLDVAISHWGTWEGQPGTVGPVEHLWRNDGDGTFTAVTAAAGLGSLTGPGKFFFTFTPNFVDVNDDGWLDLLFVEDFGNTQYFLSNGDGTFTEATDDVITDENGMGSAIGDYDNDGDLDWFVSSVWDADGIAEGNWGVTGNRLYRNRGDGTFDDATTEAGVRIGHWGWGSCFADFNLDGDVDIFHVNGINFPVEQAAAYQNDPSMLYLSNGNGTFTSRAAELGLIDTRQGRGIVCFDYDHDGDIDIFVANNDQPARLFRNDLPGSGNFLQVALHGCAPNTEGIGARVLVTTGARRQTRLIRAGSNFESQNPAVAHFGLGDAFVIDELTVVWPSGQTTVLDDVPANQFLTIYEQQ